MWVAFRTLNDTAYSRDDGDRYEVKQTEVEALALLSRWQDDSNTYCAGVAKITAATEPHWTEG